MTTFRPLMIALALALPAAGACQAAPEEAAAAAVQPALASVIAGTHRSEANRARDGWRHPAETLAFFGVEADDTVVEIWPGGGWYAEILAPYLATGGGTYVAAAAGERGLNGVRKLAAAEPELFGEVTTATFPVLAAGGTPVAPGSADVVLTFRNVHNWMMGDEPFEAAAFEQMYAMLKPGGTLGVVEHRLPEEADAARERSSGYVKTSTIKRLAEAAGFRLVAASEINANPKDTADHDKGVWTLPPTLTLGEVDRAKYQAIGESDRMTLKFVKPN